MHDTEARTKREDPVTCHQSLRERERWLALLDRVPYLSVVQESCCVVARNPRVTVYKRPRGWVVYEELVELTFLADPQGEPIYHERFGLALEAAINHIKETSKAELARTRAPWFKTSGAEGASVRNS